jgi:hypothetical protein
MSQHIGASEVNPFSPGNCCGWRNVNVPSLNVYVFLSHFCNNVILNYRFYKAGFFTSFSLLSTQHGFFRRLQKGGRLRWISDRQGLYVGSKLREGSADACVPLAGLNR